MSGSPLATDSAERIREDPLLATNNYRVRSGCESCPMSCAPEIANDAVSHPTVHRGWPYRRISTLDARSSVSIGDALCAHVEVERTKSESSGSPTSASPFTTQEGCLQPEASSTLLSRTAPRPGLLLRFSERVGWGVSKGLMVLIICLARGYPLRPTDGQG
jgi:hypothetical protein